MLVVHAADLHIDSPLGGLERYPGAPVDAIRGATRRAFEGLVALCLEERAALLLIAGDVFDGDWKDYSTGLFFAKELLRLRDGGTRVVMVRGNHDAASQITKHLKLPDHVSELPSARPDSVMLEDLGIAVHGQSYRTRAVTDDLAATYPDPVRGYLNFGLLHTSLTGREGHEPYAPTSGQILAAKGYDYWALGHVHQREVVSERPFIVYPGNLQGRHARETGEKGATLVHVEGGRIRSVEARPFDVVRWDVRSVDVGAATNVDDVFELCRKVLEQAVATVSGRALCARLVLRGATRVHAALMRDPDAVLNQVRLTAADVRGDDVWIEGVRIATQPFVELSRLAERRDAAGQVARALTALQADPSEVAQLFSGFSELQSKLPPEVREGLDSIHLDDPRLQQDVLEDVVRLLVPELGALGDDA